MRLPRPGKGRICHRLARGCHGFMHLSSIPVLVLPCAAGTAGKNAAGVLCGLACYSGIHWETGTRRIVGLVCAHGGVCVSHVCGRAPANKEASNAVARIGPDAPAGVRRNGALLPGAGRAQPPGTGPADQQVRVAGPGDLEIALPAGGALARLREEIGDSLGYQAYPSWFQEWTLIEREAKRLRGFEPTLVPGLLETADYARVIFGTRSGVTSEEIDEQATARLKRQEILDRDQPPELWVIIDESVLSRPVGGVTVR